MGTVFQTKIDSLWLPTGLRNHSFAGAHSDHTWQEPRYLYPSSVLVSPESLRPSAACHPKPLFQAHLHPLETGPCGAEPPTVPLAHPCRPFQPLFLACFNSFVTPMRVPLAPLFLTSSILWLTAFSLFSSKTEATKHGLRAQSV